MRPDPRWNATTRPYPRAELIHELVRGQAARRPEAVALVDGADRVTYGELDAASDEYAVVLSEMGVGPGSLVPVVMARSARLVAVLLAVLKRGAAYGALDARWPAGRLAAIARQCGSVLVADDTGGSWPVPAWPVPRTGLAAVAAAARPHDPVAVPGDAPCSVFFTSGTTGTPKGVVSPHRGTVRLFHECDFADFDERTVMPQAAPMPWDAFNLELWSTLMNGGTSVLVHGEHLLPGRLREMVADHGVNTVWLTASLFNLYVDEDPGAFDGVRHVMTGGERLSVPHVRRFLDRHPGVRLTNAYGPVESTIFATTHPITPGDLAAGAQIPIGRPVANTQVHVLDGERICQVGEQGEICITGDGLATEYLGDPAQTARRFVTLFLGGVPTRAYRTGDLGSWSDNGLLHFAGRADRQVKIRGNRIEPAGIERTAEGVPGVHWCAAVPEAEEGSYRRLVLFYRSGDGLEPSQLIGELERRLPGYLVPDEVRRIQHVPLTPTGKLDHAELLRTTRPAAPAADPSPSGDRTCAELAAAYAEVLGVREVPHDVSFFALGGTSLDAMRLCTRVESRFGSAVPTSQLFRTPQVKALAAWLDSPRADLDQDIPDPARVPLLPMQIGFLLKQQLDPDEVSGLCRLAWWLDGTVREQSLADALRDVAARHEALRARYVIDDPPVALAGGRPEPAWQVLPDEPDEDRAWRALDTALVRPLRIEEGEVWRAGLVRARDTGRRLFEVAVHHVAFDEWSQDLLCADLSDAYQARRGRPQPPTLARIAGEHRRRLRHTDLAAQREYWRSALRGLPRLAVPDVPGTPAGASPALTWEITAAELAAWDKAAQGHGTTRFTMLLAAYADALHRVTGQPDFAVGTPVSLRGGRILDQALTCLIDTVCIRLRPGLAEDADDLITQVRNAAGAALAAADVPFSEVVDLVKPVRDGTSNPLYQAMFSLHEAEPVLRLEGCEARFRRPEPAEATCDLVTGVWPHRAGGCLVHVKNRPHQVPAAFAHAVGEELAGTLRAGPSSLRAPLPTG
ncbi:non-ribosomal peptide synthetase [Actinomadura macrotermitis]|uniref:Tyrocidine synthase 3 n=1 Tax=Actinomadura macrotermitis TaxID=2585200 RepID=A0A7K0BLQ6_9ACTN|nr:non-ribosomal peptide synthetase [Actinomadura macrotermitis]MQY02118.1 Tyrocidine synthase 3 [Actinomadura macrotermitis]